MAITAVASAVGAIKTATDIVKTILAMNTDAAINEKVAELQSVILSLQSHTLSMQAEYSDLLKVKDKLEKELMECKDWEKTKEQYELKEVESGVFVYSCKQGDNLPEPEHWLCTNCYKDKKKSILQHDCFKAIGRYFCPECKAIIHVSSKRARPLRA